MSQNLPHYDVTHKKTETQNQKIFFSIGVSKLAKSFQGLNSSLVQSAEELCGW